MISEEDFKYCELNEASEGIFPTYFLLDLKLTNQQKETLKKLIGFLDNVKNRHTPPSPKKCPTCGQVPIIAYADTWCFSEHIQLGDKVDFIKKLLEPNRIDGDHT